ncbi:MAG: membrane protein insertase YidC [Burkholderiales bacterium]
MDTQRIVLLLVFTVSLFLLHDAWQRQHAVPQTPSAATDAARAQPGEVPAPSAATGTPTALPSAPQAETLAAGESVEVTTDVIRAQISTAGGDLRRLELLRQADNEDLKKSFQLLGEGQGRAYLAQSGLIGEGLPNHKTVWTPRAKTYQLAEGADVLEVKLDASGGGVRVTKTYRFHRDSYLIELDHEIVGAGNAAVQPYLYFQFVRDGEAPAGTSRMAPTFTGIGVYTAKDKFQKVSFEDIAKGKLPYPRNSTDGWIAIIQHYFLSAWLPASGAPREFFTKRLADNLYSAGVIVPSVAVEPGQTVRVPMSLYSGPQDQERLQQLAASAAPGLDLAVDYGWLTVIAYPLFWVLAWLHKLVGNWGYAIILLTILIKAAFYPLSAASYRSMAKMKVLAPKLQRLKEQYGDDRQRLHQAMMELYKTEKINPLGGCLPIVVQIPVFIALYWVLLSSIELRQAPFILWIHDLSKPDPYYILPILMGISMILQSRLSPAPPDPIQARMMQIMPIVFSVFFFFFPAGLVLYWLVNNIISIAQQWYITRGLERQKGAVAKT